MNRKEILNMPAGRDIDALVAEKVMDGVFIVPPLEFLRLTFGEDVSPHQEMWKIDGLWMLGGLPHYSTDIATAWKVVEKIRLFTGTKTTVVSPMQRDDNTWEIVYMDAGWNIYNVISEGKTLSEAICRAALLAVEET